MFLITAKDIFKLDNNRTHFFKHIDPMPSFYINQSVIISSKSELFPPCFVHSGSWSSVL